MESVIFTRTASTYDTLAVLTYSQYSVKQRHVSNYRVNRILRSFRVLYFYRGGLQVEACNK